MPPDPQVLAAMNAGGQGGLGAPSPDEAAAGGQPLPQPQKKAPPRRPAHQRYSKKTVKRS